MPRSRASAIWLAFLLLFVQQGAVLHALWHAVEDIRYSQRQDQHPGGHSDVCDRCAAYAPGGAALPVTPLAFAALGPAPLYRAEPHLSELARPPAAYRSRAPPFLPV